MGDIPDLIEGSAAFLNRNAGGRTPFLQARRFGNFAAADRIESITPTEGKYVTPDREGPVMMAARSGFLGMLDRMLAQGYDVSEEERFGETAQLDVVEYNNIIVAQRLLEAVAESNKGCNISH